MCGWFSSLGYHQHQFRAIPLNYSILAKISKAMQVWLILNSYFLYSVVGDCPAAKTISTKHSTTAVGGFIEVESFSRNTSPCKKYLNTKVYTVENIPPSLKILATVWFSFIYTSTVFFRLTLKIENIKFEKKLGTTYLILMYTVGLICLAYMANFVLQK